MEAAHANRLKLHFKPNFIYRADAPIQSKVAIISTEGRDREPMPGSFVGLELFSASEPKSYLAEHRLLR